MKEYIELEMTSRNSERHLEISTGYELGGYNYFSGVTNKRGYYLYVMPVTIQTRDDGRGGTYDSIMQQLGKGTKILLKEVKRQSKKSEADAENLAEQKKRELIDFVCKNYDLILKKKMEESEA